MPIVPIMHLLPAPRLHRLYIEIAAVETGLMTIMDLHPGEEDMIAMAVTEPEDNHKNRLKN